MLKRKQINITDRIPLLKKVLEFDIYRKGHLSNCKSEVPQIGCFLKNDTFKIFWEFMEMLLGECIFGEVGTKLRTEFFANYLL